MTAVTDETKSIGLDYKSDGLYMDSDGNIGTNHKYFRNSQKKLAGAQKKLSRMLEQNIDHYIGTGKGRKPVWKRPIEECRNIQKQKRKVAKIYSHTANQSEMNTYAGESFDIWDKELNYIWDVIKYNLPEATYNQIKRGTKTKN